MAMNSWAIEHLGSADPRLEPVAGMMAPPAMARPQLAVDRVRFVGEPIAVVVAETATQAADGASSCRHDS